jgi:hypothetical protein
MCDCERTRPEPVDCSPTRRQLIAGALTVGVGAAALGLGVARPVLAEVAAVEVMPGLAILPRDAWGLDLPPKGPLAGESSQFLLVHHSATPNTYRSARAVVRAIHTWHTGPAKGWSDVCYNFFVGRDGDVWEGRAGSLTRPITADATGGNQGFAQLVCLIGDFTTEQPTASARHSLAKVLAWLAGRDGIDISASATTTFTSRGSQRWPVGTEVTTATIAAHRDLSSNTTCPGDAFHPFLDDVRSAARAQRDGWSAVTRPAVRLGVVAP